MTTLSESNASSEALSEMLSPQKTLAPNEVVIGTVSSISEEGQPVVEYMVNGAIRAANAITTQLISPDSIGRQVALMFVNADAAQPIVMGMIKSPLDAAIETFEISAPSEHDQKIDDLPDSGRDEESKELNVDGKRVVIEGKEEVVLKCGNSSITLTKQGKILIRGKYLVSRSSGVNRILGGSVQVN